MNYFETNHHLAQAIIQTQEQIETSYRAAATDTSNDEVRHIFYEVSEQEVSEQEIFEALSIACEFLLNSGLLPEGPQEVTVWLNEHKPDIYNSILVERIRKAKSVREALKAAINFETQVLSFYRKAREAIPGNSLQIEVVIKFLQNHIEMLKGRREGFLEEFEKVGTGVHIGYDYAKNTYPA